MLLHYGSSANTVALGGWTPLQVIFLGLRNVLIYKALDQVACENGHLATARLLLMKGADMEVFVRELCTPFPPTFTGAFRRKMMKACRRCCWRLPTAMSQLLKNCCKCGL
jgi:hypothetical protein